MKTEVIRWVRGFTIIEVLLVITVISLIGSATYYTVSSSQETARERKLESDVASLNSAVQVYLANGGNLPDDLTADQALAKLKTRADSSTGSQSIGLKGSTIDARIESVWQTGDEAAEAGKLRAIWNGEQKRFVVAEVGEAGIKRFELNPELAGVDPVLESRTNNLTAATETQWVWDFNESTNSAAILGNNPGTGAGAGYTPPTGAAKNPLDPPTFSREGGSIALIEYNLPLTLTNPNPSGTSQIFYATGGSPYVLYKGETLSIAPDQAVSAYAATVDPDQWDDSSVLTKTYAPIPVVLSISLNQAQAQLTYQQAGGQMTDQALTTPVPSTVNLLSAAQIPSAFLNSSNFQIYYTTDGSDPTASGTATAGAAFAGTFVSPQMDVSLSRWGTASTLTLRAIARSLNARFFTASPVVTQTIGITPTNLSTPAIDPPSGAKAADLPVSIALAGGSIYPAGARIYYTLDGTDPGNNAGNPTGGTLYSSQFNSGAGENGVVTVTARVYGPVGFGHWFTPSPISVATYATVTLVDGALVGNANLNGTFVGSLVYASPASGGTMNNITFNSGARILQGNLYLPGTPTIRRTNGTVWSSATDAAFSTVIQGWEYSNNVKTVQTTPRVLNENGSVTPDNYSVTFNNSALLEGKVIRRHDSPAFPTIAPPPPRDSNGSTSLNSPPVGPLSASTYSSITLNSAPVGDVRLLPGNYENLNANNGTAFVLGDPDNPEVTQFYSWKNLNLNSGSDIKIVGKVIITVSNGINLSTGSTLGNVEHPEWMQLQFSSGDMNANSGSYVYAQLVAPTSSVTFNAGSIFNGSVTAKTLTINSNGVVFSLPPVIAN